MSVLTRNNIVTNGLVLALDAKNPQSLPNDPTVNLKNYFLLDYPEMPTYSIRGADSLICFFIVFIIYSFILRFLIDNFYIDKYFLNCVFAYLLISLFRGNYVHNLNFIIKIYLLIIFLTWTIQKIQQLRLRVV